MVWQSEDRNRDPGWNAPVRDREVALGREMFCCTLVAGVGRSEPVRNSGADAQGLCFSVKARLSSFQKECTKPWCKTGL